MRLEINNLVALPKLVELHFLCLVLAAIRSLLTTFGHDTLSSWSTSRIPMALLSSLHSTLVRASARGAGGRGSIPDCVTPKT